MIYKTKREKVDSYFMSENMSQSQLKLFIQGVDIYVAEKDKAQEKDKYYDEPAEHFIYGSAIDCKLTEEEDSFNLRYHISTLDKKPSDAMISIVKKVFDEITEEIPFPDASSVGAIDDYREAFLRSCEYHTYQPKYGDDAKMNAIRTQATNYWNELIVSSNKQILTLENMIVINAVVESVLQDSNVGRFFLANPDFPDVDIFHQFPIYTRIGGVQVKGLLDLLIIDHANATITICDFKTIGDTVLNFPRALRRRRYDIQVAFYQSLLTSIWENCSLEETLSETYDLDSYSHNFNDYRILLPTFIVQSTKYNNNPVTYQTTPELIQMGQSGRTDCVMAYVHVGSESNLNSIEMDDILGYSQLLIAYKDYQNGLTSHHPLKLVGWNSVKDLPNVQ